MALPTRTLGRTGLEVTTLGYGAMELRNRPPGRETTEEQANAILNAVLDAGINFIDTSIDYGESEERIGRYISHRRSEYFLASKCGCAVGATGPSPHIFTKENIVAGVEQSLRRMKTDYLDLVQFHMSPSKETLDENRAIDTLKQLQAAGKIRFIASSSTLPNMEDHVAMGVFDAFQIPYSGLQRQHEEIISRAARAGAGTIIRGGAARGAPGKDWSVGIIGVPAETASDIWQKAGIDELRGEMSAMEFTLRFTLSHPDLHTTIVGTSNPDHLHANVEAATKGSLPAEVYEEAKRRLAEQRE